MLPEIVRWIASIVATVCLLAATAVGPVHDPRSAAAERQPQLVPAHAPALAVAQRRDGARSDLRLAPFALSAPTELPAPPRTRVAGAPCVIADLVSALQPAPRARGPPRA